MGRFLRDNGVVMVLMICISLALVYAFAMVFDMDIVIIATIALLIDVLHFIKDYWKFRKEDRRYYHY